MRTDARLPAWLLNGLLGAGGVTHFAVPGPYDGLIPSFLPGWPRLWTYGSGVLELAIGAAVAHPTTRRRGAQAAALLFVAVFPANIKMAIDWSDRSLPEQAIAYARLPLQVPLVLWALSVARTAGQREQREQRQLRR